MKYFGYLIVLSIISLSACLLKPTYKNFYDVKEAFTMEQVEQLWGAADIVRSYDTVWGKQKLLVYRCIKTVSCNESDCLFGAPCYFLLFDHKGWLISKYDAGF